MTRKTKFQKVSPRLLIGTGFITMAVLAATTPSFALADTIYRQLQVGSSGSDVSSLQTFLAKDVSLYPQGLVTGYFGFLTKSAVSNFQSRNGLDPVGRVGPKTIPILNAQMNGASSGVDVNAPMITSVTINTTNTTATFNWNTNDLARGKVYYSTSPIQLRNTFDETGVNFVEPTVTGTLANYDGVARVSQAVSISGLAPDTTYYYLVEALDASNNVTITSPASFHTTQ